jgi:hypothetical protein
MGAVSHIAMRNQAINPEIIGWSPSMLWGQRPRFPVVILSGSLPDPLCS